MILQLEYIVFWVLIMELTTPPVTPFMHPEIRPNISLLCSITSAIFSQVPDSLCVQMQLLLPEADSCVPLVHVRFTLSVLC